MENKYLVIVESPAKAKTIGKYLGGEYQVKACMGHLRDLPKSVLGVDIEHDFTPDYRPIKGKEELIRELKKLAENSQMVYLATDPDREGEAISWHLQQLLQLDPAKTKRVTFNEITKSVVTESIRAPRQIDNDLVDAQQARRILDRVVGYQLSPLLWKKVRRGLSAGRVQSVATRLVDDREKEIRHFVPEEYWSLEAQLSKEKPGTEFTAHYFGKNGKKVELHSLQEVERVIEEAKRDSFTVSSVKRIDKQRSPSPPFTTSTLQQEASRKLNMTPRRTMAIAQQLYEGVELSEEGSVGLITYMRTDSLRVSEEAMAAAKKLIQSHYGAAYYPSQPRHYKAKGNAQDAHEAIRPSNVTLLPEDVKGDLTPEQYRLYRLIWSRFMASQMANAVYDSITVETVSGGHEFRAGSSRLKFAGYTAVYEESRDEEKEEKNNTLPELTEGETLLNNGFAQEQHFTQPPTRYTDASLIRALEEQGIGRPSTYAPTVSTIIDREYVAKDGKYLRITPLGEVVTGLMEDKFRDIVDVGFTAQMEQQLDEVEAGSKPWKDLLREFYGGFSQSLSQAEKELEGIHLKVQDEVSEEKCDLCGRNMVIKTGRFGRFLACPGYPDCQFTKPLVVEMPGRCPKCGGRLLKRTGVSKKTNKQYTYYACEHVGGKTNSPLCDFMTWDVPVKDDCPACGQTMFKRSGRGYKRPYCINPACRNFLPEEKRGYYPKAESSGAEAKEKTAKEKTAARKTTAKASAKGKTAGKTGAAKTGGKKTARTGKEE